MYEFIEKDGDVFLEISEVEVKKGDLITFYVEPIGYMRGNFIKAIAKGKFFEIWIDCHQTYSEEYYLNSEIDDVKFFRYTHE